MKNFTLDQRILENNPINIFQTRYKFLPSFHSHSRSIIFTIFLSPARRQRASLTALRSYLPTCRLSQHRFYPFPHSQYRASDPLSYFNAKSRTRLRSIRRAHSSARCDKHKLYAPSNLSRALERNRGEAERERGRK